MKKYKRRKRNKVPNSKGAGPQGFLYAAIVRFPSFLPPSLYYQYLLATLAPFSQNPQTTNVCV